MKCQLKNCSNHVPKTRNKTAKYCSDVCYYEAKKERSSRRYAALKEPAEEVKRCVGILAYLFGISQLKKPITSDDLQSLGFNFSLCTSEHLDDKKRLFKVIGNYAYYIGPDKSLIIWKSK